MATVHTEVSGVIDAPPATVYAVLADYRSSHPQILPKPYFTNLIVEQGGQGAGTVFRTQVVVMGVKTDYHMVVSEPRNRGASWPRWMKSWGYSPRLRWTHMQGARKAA